MALSDPDLSFANQVDAYISDDDESTLPSHSQHLSPSPSDNLISTPITPTDAAPVPLSRPRPHREHDDGNDGDDDDDHNANHNNRHMATANFHSNSNSNLFMSSDMRAHFIQKPALADITSSQSSLPHTRPALAAEPASPNPNDSLKISRLRLNRFHDDAKSFVSAKLPPLPAGANAAASNAKPPYMGAPSALFDTHPRPHSRGGPQVDSDRLARFHAQAVSFLDRAYADNPSSSAPVLLGDEKLTSSSSWARRPAPGAQSRLEQRQMLQQFHSEALHFLDTAAAASLTTEIAASASDDKLQLGELRKGAPRSGSPLSPAAALSPPPTRPGDATSERIVRDKARLEQHYRDAMSFLNRPDNDRRMIEEQELESATVERFQLQKYAREAMSFLDKAFRGDASVMVRDDHDDEQSSGNPSPERQAAGMAPGLRDNADTKTAGDADTGENRQTDEAGQIAADRAALEHYDQEFGRFLSQAYDDINIIVDDADTDTSNGTDRGLFALRMAPSSSAGTGYSGSASNDDEQLSEEAFTDEEFQGKSEAGAEEMAMLRGSFPARSDSTSGAPTPITKQSPLTQLRTTAADNTNRLRSTSPSDDMQDSEAVRSRMARYEREAARYIDGANVSDDEEPVPEIAAEPSPPARIDAHTPSASPPSAFQLDGQSIVAFEQDDLLGDRRARRAQRPPSMDESHVMRAHQRPGARADGPSQHSQYVESRSTSSSENGSGIAFGYRDSARRSTPPQFARLPDHKADGRSPSPNSEADGPAAKIANAAPSTATPTTGTDGSQERSSRDTSASASPRSARGEDPNGNVKLDVTLEHGSGRKQYREMPIERSFYRQIPRGATIKLRPRMSPPLSSSSRTTGTSAGPSEAAFVAPGISVDELRRVEKERDVLMATLEEIVNERSQLAAQVSEMKSMIRNVGGKGDASPTDGKRDSADSQEPDIDLGAELREAHAIMEKMTEEMDETLSVLDGRYQDTLQRAHAAEEKCIRLEANASRQDSQFAAQGARLTAALAEERRLSALLSRTEKEFEELRLKSESDIQKIQDEYRDDGDRKMSRIRELTSEVAVLHDRLRDAATGEERQAMLKGSKKLELEVASLKDMVTDLEAQLSRERDGARRKREKEREALQREADDRADRLSGQLRAAQRVAQEAQSLRGELDIERSERARAMERADQAERAKAETDGQLVAARRALTAAEVETSEIRSRFEDSVKQRISQMDQTGELVELQSALQALRDGAAEREGNLQKQLEEFKTRAEQAEQAATSAERGAKEAAEMARLAQERSRAAVESERQARQEAESDKAAIAAEWEKFSKRQEEKQRKEEVLVAKSSSRRGLRKSPSKSLKDERKKKRKEKEKSGEDSKSGGGEDNSTRKKSSHRARLFG